MKTSIWLTIFILLVGPALLFAQTKDFKRYSIESGIVEYELTGIQVGQATLYFDNYGMVEATYEKAVMDAMGFRRDIEFVNYLDGYWQYNWDKIINSATKMKNTILADIIENAEDGDLAEAGMVMLKAMGAEKIGEEVLLGKACDIWEVQQLGTKLWVWKGVTLKSNMNMMGMIINRVATSIAPDAPIPSDKISLPEGVEFLELTMPTQLQDRMKDHDQED